METTITITAEAGSGKIRVRVNGSKVLDGPGSATVVLGPGKHKLTYAVNGTFGMQYKVAIISPADQLWEADRTLASIATAGQHTIRIQP